MKTKDGKKLVNFKRFSVIYSITALNWVIAAILQFIANNKVLGWINICAGILSACAAFISMSRLKEEKDKTNDNI